MATATTRLALRKPDTDPTTGDFVDADADLNDNFDKLDAAIGAIPCLSSLRPAAPYNGQFARETDTGKLIMWNGTDWLQLFIEGQAFWNLLITVARSSSTGGLIAGKVTTDTTNRLQIDVAGKHEWGPGAAVAVDTNLYRTGVGALKTDGSLAIGGGIVWGATAVTVKDQVSVTGSTTSVTYTATLTSSTTPGVVFIAPPSGKVIVHWHCGITNSNAATLNFMGWEIRAGGSIGTGTSFLAADDTRAIQNRPSGAGGTDDAYFGSTDLVTGLTPGNTYNIRGMYKTDAGTAFFLNRRIMVQPTL